MANLIKTFIRHASLGLKAGLPYAGLGGGTRSTGLAEWYGWNKTLPGTNFDYKFEAGNLWENQVILTIVKWVSRRWGETKTVVYRPSSRPDGKPKMIRDCPLLDVLNLKWPGAQYDRSVMEMGIILSWMIAGNAYLYKERGPMGNVIGLRYIPHFQITPYWPKDGSQFISGYVYTVNGTWYLIPKEDIIHLRDGIDPNQVRMGLGCWSASLREVCSDNEGATYSAAILRQMGIPGVVITPKALPGGDVLEPLTTEKKEEFTHAWLTSMTGDGRGKPYFSNMPVDINAPGFSPEQLVLDKTRSIPVGRICSAAGFDPMVFGYPSESKTYANFGQALEAAYEGTIIPMQAVIDSQMTAALINDVLFTKPNEYIGRDYSNVRALQADMDALSRRICDEFQKGVITRFDARIALGYDADPVLDDVYFTDLAGTADVPDENDANAQGEDQTEGADASKSRRYRIRTEIDSPGDIRRMIATRWQSQKRKAITHAERLLSA